MLFLIQSYSQCSSLCERKQFLFDPNRRDPAFEIRDGMRISCSQRFGLQCKFDDLS